MSTLERAGSKIISNDEEYIVKFYHYPNCSTCRKAGKWLDTQGIDVEKIHLVEQTPTRSELERLWKTSGLDLKRFFNTSGGSYRSLKLKDTYDDLSNDERLELLANDGMLIKRPILDAGDVVLVGFKPETWTDELE